MSWDTFVKKVTSRKFWAAVGLVLYIVLGADIAATLQAGLATALGVGYMIAEGLADGGKKSL